MAEERGFKQNFIRSFIIGAVISFVAYMIIVRVNWARMGLDFDGGPKPDAAVEEAARAAAVTETIRVGGKTWMKRNLNVWTRNSWCYDDNQDNCAEYGRLYTWHAAKRACASLGDGWRLSTRHDWDALVNAAGGANIAGTRLKSQTGWPPVEIYDSILISVGTDDFGFSALPGGERYGEAHWKPEGGGIPVFYGVGHYHGVGVNPYARWWTATSRSKGRANLIGIGPAKVVGLDDHYWNTDGYSVRCVKD